MNTIQQIAYNLRNQNNQATAHPIYVVQEQSRQYGIDPEYTDDAVWVSSEGEADEQESAWLDKLEQDGRGHVEWHKIGYVDSWKFVTVCLTHQGAQDYIDQNLHNLRNPRIYVDSACRNNEIIALRNFLISQIHSKKQQDAPQ